MHWNDKPDGSKKTMRTRSLALGNQVQQVLDEAKRLSQQKADVGRLPKGPLKDGLLALIDGWFKAEWLEDFVQSSSGADAPLNAMARNEIPHSIESGSVGFIPPASSSVSRKTPGGEGNLPQVPAGSHEDDDEIPF